MYIRIYMCAYADRYIRKNTHRYIYARSSTDIYIFMYTYICIYILGSVVKVDVDFRNGHNLFVQCCPDIISGFFLKMVAE